MQRIGVQTALGLAFLLPPPASGALRLARLHSARAGRTAYGKEALSMQRVHRHAVIAGKTRGVGARPVIERVDLDQAAGGIDAGEGDFGAMFGLIGAQTGDPSGGAFKRAIERFDLAHMTTSLPRRDRTLEPAGTLFADQCFERALRRHNGAHAPAIFLFGRRPDVMRLRKQPAGVERHQIDIEPLAEDCMTDGLVFDPEARRKNPVSYTHLRA